MGTISKVKVFNSIQLRFTLVYALLIGVLLAVFNVYPVVMSRDLVFRSKQTALQNQASVIASSLSSLGSLTRDEVSRVISLLDRTEESRILVTDTDGEVLYDNRDDGENVGKYALLGEINWALQGNDVFYSAFLEGGFQSRAAVPVTFKSNIIGAVCIYEEDSDSGALISGIQSSFGTISLIVGVAALLLSVWFTRLLTRRITDFLKAIKHVREGQYSYRMVINGADELAEMGREFNSMTDRMQKTEEIRQRFVADASHELKTPLASIRLLSDSILQSREMDEETMREFVFDIGNEVERLTRMTEKLLNLTKLDSVPVKDQSLTDIRQVAARTLHMLRPLAEEAQVSIRLEDGWPSYVHVGEDDLYQIIFNLVENGIKYNKKGGSVTVSTDMSGGETRLLVSDDGIGIPEEDREHIFERFYRVDKARSRERGGSGLGLSIVMSTARQHGGNVEVRERPGGGTVFCVTFPAAQPEPEEGADTE